MIVFKVFNHINHATKGKKCFVGIKIDMEKAYDRLECNFIRETYDDGFSKKIVNITMACMTSSERPINNDHVEP